MNKDNKLLNDVTHRSLGQTIKDVASAYGFIISYVDALDRFRVKSENGEFYWDESLDMQVFWDNLRNYFVVEYLDQNPYG